MNEIMGFIGLLAVICAILEFMKIIGQLEKLQRDFGSSINTMRAQYVDVLRELYRIKAPEMIKIKEETNYVLKEEELCKNKD